MPRGVPHPPEIRAAAIAAIASGDGIRATARRLGVNHQVIRRWWAEDRPEHSLNARTREELSNLIYDAVVDALGSLRARAIETSRPEWIRQQDAHGIADLDRAQWDRVIRMVGAFEPVEDGQSVAHAGELDGREDGHANAREADD